MRIKEKKKRIEIDENQLWKRKIKVNVAISFKALITNKKKTMFRHRCIHCQTNINLWQETKSTQHSFAIIDFFIQRTDAVLVFEVEYIYTILYINMHDLYTCSLRFRFHNHLWISNHLETDVLTEGGRDKQKKPSDYVLKATKY